MGETGAMRALSANLGVCGGEIQTRDPTPGGSASSRVVESDAERAGYLVKCAMRFMESDLHAAWRCLQDASTLLAVESPSTGIGSPPSAPGFRSGGLARWQAKRAVAYIEANLASKMETRELAHLLSFSKSHFSRAFKRTLGVPPMTYVITRRVERAKLMMTTTCEQLTDIALACGFADQSHLNRSFRRMVGMSPGLWRRMAAGALELGGGASA